MAKKYYIKHVHAHRTQSHPFLIYAFISANSVVVVLALLFFNPSMIRGTYVSPVEHDVPAVQGVSDVRTEALPEPTPTQVTIISPEPTPTPLMTKKKSYRIAIYGDSMVDTMGELLEYLDHSLKKKYPNTTFGLFNYGKGSQNIEEGLDRFNSEFKYQTRTYPPFPQINADIIIIGSFAYNPFSPHDRDRHWLALTHLVQAAQKTGAKVYMLAEIAPLSREFGKGPQGVNWSTEASITQSRRIREQLENAIGLSQTLHVPIIDVYTPSKDEKTGDGNKKYINPSDGIHPSVEGHEFTADKIVESLAL